MTFSQVDFTWPVATTLDSNTGEVAVDVAALRVATGIQEGFININTSLGWVVQNLPVFADFTYPRLSTTFKLNQTSGININAMAAYVLFSPTPLTSAPSGPPTTFPVGNTQVNPTFPAIGGF